MSDDPGRGTEPVLKRVKDRVLGIDFETVMHRSLPAFKKMLDEQISRGLLTKEMADQRFSELERKYTTPPKLTVDELDTMAFIERLKHRQGNIELDFPAVYERQAELDQESP